MAIKVKRKGNEPPDRVLSRFNRLVQSARILQSERANRRHKRAKSKLKQKITAIIREEHRRENLKKQFYT